jgi:uncharacterized protein (UPF0332 family)
MTYDWIDYLDISKEMISTFARRGSINPKRKETMLRIAISRAYYAAFHKCRDYVLARGARLDEMGAHRDLIDKVDLFIASGEAPVSMELNRAFISRKKADYNDTFRDLEKESQLTIKRVEKIISEILSRG